MSVQLTCLMLQCGRCGARFAEDVATGSVERVMDAWYDLHPPSAEGECARSAAAFAPPVPEDIRMRLAGAPALPGFD